MKKFTHIILSFCTGFLMLANSAKVNAQVYPVDVTTNLTPPYSAFIADYSQAGSNKWMSNITLRDANEPSVQVRLHLTIESSSIKLETKPNFIPNQPITLTPNVPVTIKGSDLLPYLDYNNLQFNGISRQQIEQNGKIPEGMYTFKIEVVEYMSGKTISRPAQASAYIQLRDQPLAVNPTCSTAVSPSQGQNTIFQWQAASPPGPGATGSTEYRFTLYEITDNTIDPMNAMTNNAVFQVYESQWQMQTTLVYGIAQPPLELGKKYLWHIRARDNRGFTSFKNNGLSEVCWFSYGYPTGGNITLNKPDDDFGFTDEDQPIFEWGAIDNDVPGQQVVYNLKIVELSNGQNPDQAIDNNQAYLSQNTAQMPATGGYQIMLDSLPTDNEYAWRVSALSDGQKVAESDVRTFTSPPFLDKFKAGNHEVLVTTLDGTDLNDISGTGKIKIGGGDSALIEIDFENLKLKEVAGQVVLDEGEIETQITMDTIGLESLTEGIPNGFFHPEKVKLNKNSLSLKGYATYPLPLVTTASQQAKVETKSDWINFDNYYLQGGLNLNENNTFNLLDPAGFTIEYNDDSELIISENRFSGDYDGEITFEDDINDSEGNPLVIPFVDFDNLHYNTISYGLEGVDINLLENTKFTLNPGEIVVDFSEDESPGTKSGQADWTGIYFTQSEFEIPFGFDENGFVYVKEDIVKDAGLTQSYMMKNSIDSKGLNFKIDYSPADELASAYAFVGDFDYLNFEIDGSDFVEGEMGIDITLTQINTETKYDVKAPLTASGFDTPYFDGDFNGTIEVDKGDDERYSKITVSDAHFDENGILDMNAVYECPALDLTVDNISNFKMSATGMMGFGGLNQAMSLETPVSCELNGLPVTVSSIAALELEGYTAIGAIATVDMGPTVAGDGGSAGIEVALTAVRQKPEPYDTEKEDFISAVVEGTASASGGNSTASGSAGASGTLGFEGGDGIGAQGGVSASASSEELQKVSDAASQITGIQFKDATVDVKADAGAMAGVTDTDHGFKFEANVYVDLGMIASVSGKVSLINDNEFGIGGNIVGGNLDFNSGIIPVSQYLDGFKVQTIMGYASGSDGVPRPVYLMRGQAGLGFPIVSPYIGLSGLGFAIGSHVSPKQWIVRDGTPIYEREFAVDLQTPFSITWGAGIQDEFELPFVGIGGGVLYDLTANLGGRVESTQEVDFSNPASLTNIRACVMGNFDGGFWNTDFSPLDLLIKDQSALALTGGGEMCYGKVMEAHLKLDGDLWMAPPIIPGIPSPIYYCGAGQADIDLKVDLENITDPTAHLWHIRYGTEQNPMTLDLFCQPSLRAFGWLDVGLKPNGKAGFDVALGVDVDVNLDGPDIPIVVGDISPYFKFQADVLGRAQMEIDLSSLSTPEKFTAAFELHTHASAYVSAGFVYDPVIGSPTDYNLGEILLSADGKLAGSTNELTLDGEFVASFGALGQSFTAKFDKELTLID
ncbi:hypothetical protein [Salibacter halophilus]|uniref:T9SS type A sorting domain-containing protein n=1 Tax=Salibacter halophilus TaxID=1803916 RepID=A0A6N6MD55_9FLAO|nr:hypothetical protein [Salibacter halophilus]KAB1065519.1 hypothetical protein F3059_02375 [Salibacter halophilus]